MAFDSRLLSGIQVLVATVEAGSFARAATTLGITPSGVSRAVARLEQRVGIRLFDRTARAVALTDEGRSFYQRVKPLLTGIEDAATEAAGAAAVVRGRLRVNVDPFFARLVLAPRLGKFLAAYPELSVEIVGRDRLGDLVADGFDAAVRFGEPEPSALVGGTDDKKHTMSHLTLSPVLGIQRWLTQQLAEEGCRAPAEARARRLVARSQAKPLRAASN
jgi:DNA-binding transcriptional LysR family regulator